MYPIDSDSPSPKYAPSDRFFALQRSVINNGPRLQTSDGTTALPHYVRQGLDADAKLVHQKGKLDDAIDAYMRDRYPDERFNTATAMVFNFRLNRFSDWMKRHSSLAPSFTSQT